MSEGRKTQVVLLDNRRLELLVQPKLYSTELLDIVASHFNLKEKEFFGLSFKDETDHHHWLHLDRKVLEHEFPKKTGPLELYFGVRFFIESIGYLKDNATIELFYLQAKQSIFKGYVEVDSETVFELAAHVVQATYGDYTDDETFKKHLKKLPVLPTSVLREHPSISYCEEQVLGHYRKLEGHTRGSAIVNYMTIVESLPTYGIHYYEVKDKSGIPWWLGLSYKGISLYDFADKRVPRRVFAWKQLENLYFRDKKFSIEVHDPKRIVHTLSSFNLYEDAIQEPIEEFDDLSDAISDPTTQVSVSRRTFGPGNVNVHAWFAATPLLTKCIWSMAVSQHQFYLDRKQSKSQLPQVRSMSEIATDLCRSSNSLHSSAANSEGISRSNSAHSLTLSTYNSRSELTVEELEYSRTAQKEMYEALEARKKLLEEALKKKTEELRQICLKEGELTGQIPKEFPLAPGEQPPQIRRRVGTAFALSPKILNRDKTTEANEALARLEIDLELQDKITKAAFKLAQDKSVAKSVRKQRKQQYHKALQKLKDIEKRLNEFREHVGKLPIKMQGSIEDLSEDSHEFLESESELISPVGSPAVNHSDIHEVGTGHQYGNHTSSSIIPHMKITASPKVEVVELESPFISSTSSSSHSPFRPCAYKTNFVHQADNNLPHHQIHSIYPPDEPLTDHRQVQSIYPPDNPSQAPFPHYHHHGNHYHTNQPGQQQVTGAQHPQHKSAPASPVRQPHGAPRVSTPSPNPGRHYRGGGSSGGSGGYIPNSVYSTRTSYRNQMYPTYSTKDQPSSHSDYENSSRSTTHVSNRHVSRIDRENCRNDAQNLYNVNTNRMACYDSADELKSPASEDYDSYCSDSEQGRWRLGADGSYLPDQPRGYGSLDRKASTRELMLSELLPSKFGSKRESHSDYRDSPYQIVDTAQPQPANISEPHRDVITGGHLHKYDMTTASEEATSQGDNTSHNTSIPYIDCSQSSISVASSGTGAPWYDNRDTGQHVLPPQTSFVRQEVQNYERGYHGYEPMPSRGGDLPYQAPLPNQHKQMTVTKYQNYVEVSKPFEMSDYFKYSERLRRQRVQDSPPASACGGPTSQSPHHQPHLVQSSPSPSPHRAESTPGQGRAPYHGQNQVQHSGSPAPYPSSTTSSTSRSRPSSPFTQPTHGQSEHPPPYGKQPTPYGCPVPGGPQAGFVQASYPPHAMSQQPSPYQQHSPKQVAYQPPKPMTCQLVRDSPSHGATNKPISHRHKDDSQNISFGSFNMGDGVAQAFSEEMLAWYDDKDGLSPQMEHSDPYTLV